MNTAPQDQVRVYRRRTVRALTPAERMARYFRLEQQSWSMMSEEGRARFHRRNRRKRRIHRPEYGNG